jgi:hypothetical protein
MSNFNSREGQRSFTIALFGVIALGTLIVCIYVVPAGAPLRFGLLALSAGSQLMLFFLILDNLRHFVFKNENKFIGTTNVEASLYRAKGEHKPVKTVIGFVPDRNKSDEVSREERAISDELKRVVGRAPSASTAREGLELLAGYRSIVEESWTHLLNKARLFQLVGRTDEAVGLAADVIERFQHSRVALGTAYEVLSWIEEFMEPKGKGEPYRLWLTKRKEYVAKGLGFFPSSHDLLMNAFEVATLEGDAAEALAYLRRAVAADRELTRMNLTINSKTRRARRLSPELKQTIQALIKGGNEMQILRMMKFRILVLVLAASLGATSGVLRLQTVAHGDGSALFPAAAVSLATAQLFARRSCKSGTSFGLLKAGTSFGQL